MMKKKKKMMTYQLVCNFTVHHIIFTVHHTILVVKETCWDLFVVGLEGAAFQSRLPYDKMTTQETNYFRDISDGQPTLHRQFLYVRNRLVSEKQGHLGNSAF